MLGLFDSISLLVNLGTDEEMLMSNWWSPVTSVDDSVRKTEHSLHHRNPIPTAEADPKPGPGPDLDP